MPREKRDGAKSVASVPGPDTARAQCVTLDPGLQTGRAPTPTCSNMKQANPASAQHLREPMQPLHSIASAESHLQIVRNGRRSIGNAINERNRC